MKKKILLVLLLFTTACTANYELVYDGEALKETVVVEGVTKDYLLSISYALEDFDKKELVLLEETDKVFAQSYTVKDDVYTIKYNGEHIPGEFTKDSLMLYCYDNVNVVEKTDTIYISAFGSGLSDRCFQDYIDASLKTNYKVISSNADKVEGNVHTWNMENHADGINILIDRTSLYEEAGFGLSTLETISLVLGIVAVIALVPLYKILKKHTDS